MGMTDRQFDAYMLSLLEDLKEALEENPDNKKLKKMIARIEGQLLRP